MKVYPMVSLEMDDEEMEDAVLPMPMERAKYPYGLRICLTNSEMEKLGIDPAAAFVGGIVHLHALARITSASSNEMEGPNGPYKCERVELQIEDMCVESEDLENEMIEEEQKRKRKILYDRS